MSTDTANGTGRPGQGEQSVEFGTGFLQTRIEAADTGFRWTRGPGPLRRDAFSPVPPQARAAVVALPPSRLTVDLGTATTDRREYRATGPQSLGHVVLNRPAAGRWPHFRPLFEALGQVLSHVHSSGVGAAGLGRPRGALRLARWLRDGRGSGTAPALRLHATAVRRLGPRRVAAALAWCDDFTEHRPSDVLLLGSVGIGTLVPDAAARTGTLLAGEELAHGPPEYDLGWIIGELAEFRLLHLPAEPDGDQAARECADASRALLRGYGPDTLDRVATGRAAALRVFTHAHDFACYVGWIEQLHSYLDLIADLIDADGMPAVPDTHPTDHPEPETT